MHMAAISAQRASGRLSPIMATLSPLSKPEGDHAQSNPFHILIVFLPGDGVPDPKLLFPHGHFFIPVFFGRPEKEFGDGQIFGDLNLFPI